MNYHNITHDDMLNGEGIRVVLWVSGCIHNCPHCQNPITHDPTSGILFDDIAKAEILKDLDKDYVSGITFSGGDPLYNKNRDQVLSLAKEIKEKYPNKTIWLYTGYLYEAIKDLEVLDYVDVLCDGRFEIDKLDVNKPWVGSTNQRVIDINKTKKNNVVTLLGE